MNFPAHLDLFGLRVHPHLLFEALGYFAGARLYFFQRRRDGVPLPLETHLWLLVGCVFGAWAGSKLLAWIESPAHYLALLQSDPAALIGGKTIVGGFLGGWAGIEVVKRRLGIVRRTGDGFIWPLAVGTAIGRIGCFLTGLEDRTHGVATGLPWGVDFGDGVARHPAQLYESVIVLGLAAAASGAANGRRLPDGARFRFFFAGYFLFRFSIEFLKPREIAWASLSAIQLASLLGAGLALVSIRRLMAEGGSPRA